jgi:hypothetical protein
MDAAVLAGRIFELQEINGVGVGTRQEQRAEPSQEE